MEWPHVQQRIRGGEDSATEFKRGVGDMRAVGRTLCAFANGAGGLLVLGIDDAGATVGASANPEAVQERLTELLHTGCGNPVSAQCGRHDTADGWVHWIDVRRHQRGYEPFMYDGRFWVRRGRATVAPSPSELQELLNAMVVAGLMERRGRGWLTMRQAMRAFNGTEPELASDQHNRVVRVTFPL